MYRKKNQQGKSLQAHTEQKRFDSMNYVEKKNEPKFDACDKNQLQYFNFCVRKRDAGKLEKKTIKSFEYSKKNHQIYSVYRKLL